MLNVELGGRAACLLKTFVLANLIHKVLSLKEFAADGKIANFVERSSLGQVAAFASRQHLAIVLKVHRVALGRAGACGRGTRCVG